jgi:uncharacterized membrane-anchored protein
MSDHPLREALAREVHARPFPPLTAPERVSHIATVSGEGGGGADHAHLEALCRRFGANPPPSDSTHAFLDLGAFRVKWERHGEFCTWTFFVHGPFANPFYPPAIAAAPEDWLADLPGARLVATHLAVERSPQPPHAPPLGFAREYLAASQISDGSGIAWTDFRLHDDGYSRILIQDRGFVDAYHVGRAAQRLLEIETYRLMALLAFPVARAAGPRIAQVDRALADITTAMGDIQDAGSAPGQERGLLERLMGLAAEIERVTAAADYRFGAARAYHALVDRRIAELREQRAVPGIPTIGEFMDRRLAPAMRSCAATAERLRAMAERLARAGTLLRTRVDIALEAQNQRLLASMDRRARIQLRLQATVEGLSVAAISYYVVGLLAYAARAGEAAGLHLPHDLAVGLAIPLVVVGVWFLVHRVRRHISADSNAREL